jgi:uncharacterized RDD family membrane protein YckC
MTEMPAPPQPPAAPPYVASGPSGPRASFGRRLVAFLVDYVLIIILYLILRAILGTAGSWALTAAVGLVYTAYLGGSPSGQTVGKKLLGIRIIDFNTGGPIGFGRGALRWVGQIVSSIPLYLGLLLDALGQGEADVERQDRDDGGRSRRRLPRREVAGLTGRR